MATKIRIVKKYGVILWIVILKRVSFRIATNAGIKDVLKHASDNMLSSLNQ
jgi:hypothetical protein